jgi:hypothetical protein
VLHVPQLRHTAAARKSVCSLICAVRDGCSRQLDTSNKIPLAKLKAADPALTELDLSNSNLKSFTGVILAAVAPSSRLRVVKLISGNTMDGVASTLLPALLSCASLEELDVRSGWKQAFSGHHCGSPRAKEALALCSTASTCWVTRPG